MTPIEIKIELMRRKTKMAAIGRRLGVTQTAVQRVIDRDMVSERIMVSIAGAICLPPDYVFPEHQFKNQPQ